jgi:hypothetical protein
MAPEKVDARVAPAIDGQLTAAGAKDRKGRME